MNEAWTQPNQLPDCGHPPGDVPVPDLGDLLALCQGLGEDGMPASALALALVTQEGTGAPTEDTVLFGSTDNHFSLWGRTLVLESLFDPRAAQPLEQISRILEEWIPNLRREEYRSEHQLHLLVTPMAAPSQVILDLCEVMYAVLWQEAHTGRWHLVLVCSACPGDGSVLLLTDGDLDVAALRTEAEQRQRREQEALERTYEELQARLDQERRRTPGARLVREHFSRTGRAEPEDPADGPPDEPSPSSGTPWMRFAAEDEP